MKQKEIIKSETRNLVQDVLKSRQELLKLRFQAVSGLLKKPSELRRLRRLIAKIKTELKVREGVGV